MSVTLQPIHGPNSRTGSGESERISHERIPSAYPVDHLNSAVTQAEQVVKSAYDRVAQEAPQQPEFDQQTERAQIEMIRLASVELNQARQDALQQMNNQWGNN